MKIAYLDEIAQATLAVFAAIRSGGFLDATPADEGAAQRHNWALLLIGTLEDKISGDLAKIETAERAA